MDGVSWLGIGAAALSAFVLGGLWYSPVMFGKKWASLASLNEETQNSANPAVTYGLSLLLSAIAAFVFAMFLGPDPDLDFALGAGFSAGLCWVAASFGINYLFEQRPLGLFFINGGYHTLQFTLYGLCLGLL